jgi:hypothetical protein
MIYRFLSEDKSKTDAGWEARRPLFPLCFFASLILCEIFEVRGDAKAGEKETQRTEEAKKRRKMGR